MINIGDSMAIAVSTAIQVPSHTLVGLIGRVVRIERTVEEPGGVRVFIKLRKPLNTLQGPCDQFHFPRLFLRKVEKNEIITIDAEGNEWSYSTKALMGITN